VLAIFLGLLSLLVFAKPVIAGEPPTQISPSNNSTVSSSTLNWQAPSYQLYSPNPYRVQVDDDSTFSSLNKDYYTNNTYYTPTLNPGTWFWRIKAKDISGTWSDWSATWSFILATSMPSSSPTPSVPPNQSPSSTPPPSSVSQPTSSFVISNTPSQIDSDQSFNVSISLSLPDSHNTDLYLKGAFKKPDSSNYFGQTKVSGSWVKNGSSYSSQYPITTDSSGNWSGNLEIQPDSDDSGFTGTGDYIFKVGRYTSSGSGPTWSNESTIKIISLGNNDQDSVSTNSPSSTTNPSTSPSSVKTKTTSSSQSKSYDTLVYRSASVAGASASAIPESKIEVKNQKQTNPMVWIGLIFIFAGIGSIGYIYLKKNGKIPF